MSTWMWDNEHWEGGVDVNQDRKAEGETCYNGWKEKWQPPRAVKMCLGRIEI